MPSYRAQLLADMFDIGELQMIGFGIVEALERVSGWRGLQIMQQAKKDADDALELAVKRSEEEGREYRRDLILNRHASEEDMENAVEQLWQEFWLPIFERECGTISKTMGGCFTRTVKAELFDAHMYAHNLSTVYDDLTGGRVSKPNTDPQVVVGIVEERRQELIGQEIIDWLETKRDGTEDRFVSLLIDAAKKEYDVS